MEDVIHGAPGWGTLLRRGAAKKCPRCGGGKVYDTWFRMKERCPTCGLLFEREPGFFVGAYFINFAIAEGLLFILVMGFVFWKDQNPEAGVVVPLVIAIFLGVFAPLVFYPFSRTIWSALDIGMTPLELREIVDAADANDGADHVVDVSETNPGVHDAGSAGGASAGHDDDGTDDARRPAPEETPEPTRAPIRREDGPPAGPSTGPADPA